MQRLVSKPDDDGGRRQEWLDCLREIVQVWIAVFLFLFLTAFAASSCRVSVSLSLYLKGSTRALR